MSETKMKISKENSNQEMEQEAIEQPEMSQAAKEWMDRANRLFEENRQLKQRLDYLQTTKEIEYITAMTTLFKVDDKQLKGIAKMILMNTLVEQKTEQEHAEEAKQD